MLLLQFTVSCTEKVQRSPDSDDKSREAVFSLIDDGGENTELGGGASGSESVFSFPSSSDEIAGGESAFEFGVTSEEEAAVSGSFRDLRPEYRSRSLPMGKNNFNPNCTNFIKNDGSLGPWGKEIVKSMRRVEQVKGRACFFGQGRDAIKFGSRCKSSDYFKSLTRSQQENIWVWFWASVAQAESSCDSQAEARGIYNKKFKRYNIADGLFQLERRNSTRNANQRDRRFCPDRVNTKNLQFQFNCTASIMAQTQCGEYLKQSSSYWQKVRYNGGQIWDLFKKHPLCR